MSHYCTQCGNSGESGQLGILDCRSKGCTAATDRADLETHLKALGRLHERDLVWEAYKLGQAKREGSGSATAANGIDYIMAAVESYADNREPSTLTRIRAMVSEGECSRAATATKSGAIDDLAAKAAYSSIYTGSPGAGWHMFLVGWNARSNFAAPANNNTEKADE